jgi:hypothetical protein
MRYKMLLAIAGVSAAIGLLLIFPFSGGGRESFAFSVSSPDGTLPALLFMTTERTTGTTLVWLASLLSAGVLGHWTATRRKTGTK